MRGSNRRGELGGPGYMNSGNRLLTLLVAGLAMLLQCYGAAHTAADTATRFELVGENPSVNGERRQVLQFEADGLVQYALILWPSGEPPAGGWPLLLFNHGYHPNPPEYGRNARGEDDRPGDYYRGVAQAFVDRGMVVLVPDFRGHNRSQGLAFTRHDDAPAFYARDTVAAFRALDEVGGLDRSRRYMLGHSMGGLVTLAAIAELGKEVAAASIWSTASSAEYLRPLADTGVPLLVQHARGDRTTTVEGSEAIVGELRGQGVEVELALYDSDDHLFTGGQFDEAVARDIAWFARSSSRRNR